MSGSIIKTKGLANYMPIRNTLLEIGSAEVCFFVLCGGSGATPGQMVEGIEGMMPWRGDVLFEVLLTNSL